MKKNLFVFALSFLFTCSLWAQVRVTGKVTNHAGEPLPGVNVIIKGTEQGTITDADGMYAITGVSTDDILVFSFIGMLTEEIPVGNQTEINMMLVQDIMSLDEVVVIGYGTVRKRDLTGAVSSVKSGDIALAPVTNTIEAIQGRIAGLDIARSNGRADAGPSILLRGDKSFQSGGEPLYIIDGIEGSITNLNPNDIESIDVLKDASSTAIYGIKGANGIIMVTTKKAKKGQTQVELNSYVSINGNPSFPRPLQGNAWLNYLNEGYYASTGIDTAGRDAILTAWGLDPNIINPYIDSAKWVDWIDESLETGIQYNTNLSVRTGNDRVQSSFSMGYDKINGIYKNDYLDKFTLRENLNIQVSDRVNAGIITGLTYTNRESRSSRINKSFGMIPLGEVYDENGDINPLPIEEMTDVISVIADNIDGTYKNNKKSINFTANPYIEIMPFKGLTFKSQLGTSLRASRQGEFNSDHTYMMLAGSQVEIKNATYSTDLDYSYTWENILDYKTTLAGQHNIAATLITSFEDSHSESSSAYSENFTYDEYLFFNLDAGLNPRNSVDYEEHSRMSYAGRMNYDFRGKYYLTGSIRFDGVSQLTNTWDYFPSGALAWRISDEPFMEWSKTWLHNLKFRTGYGIAGSFNIEPYSSFTEVTNGKDLLNLGSGQLLSVVPTQYITNLELGWEKTYSLNIGLDFALFKSRIDGTFEWYNQDSRHLIYDRNLPFSSGGFGPKDAYRLAANIASMNNKGIELTLNTRNIQTNDFQWTSTITFSRNWNEIVSIDLGSGSTPDDFISLELFIGEPKDVHYYYNKTGIWQTKDTADAAVFSLQPGDVKLATSLTKESDGVWSGTVTGSDGSDSTVYYTSANPYQINANNDRQVLGQKKPKWIAGFNNTFTYKGFDLNIFVTARWGHMIKGQLLGYFDHGRINIPDNYDYWTETNPTNDYPRPYESRSATAGSKPLGDEALMYVDASYLKIKNITLGYTLPNSIMNRMFIKNLRVYGTVYNSIILTKSHLLKGIDPESGASDSFPLYKQLVFGINASF